MAESELTGLVSTGPPRSPFIRKHYSVPGAFSLNDYQKEPVQGD